MKLKRMLGALMAMVMVMGCTVSAIAEESVWSISREILGRGADWTKIYDLNIDIINNPDKISRGQVLKMPAA